MTQGAAGLTILNNAISLTQDDGAEIRAAATSEGHLEVAIHAPRGPFGSIMVESHTPVFQSDACYGVNSGQVQTTTSGTGTATASDGCFVVTTGTTIYSQGILQSRKRLRYRPGQGVIGRFTAAFTTGVASSYQVAGFGHAEDGIYVGYYGTSFGILYSNRGVREVRTLTITTASSHSENVTVTLNGTANTIAVTNSANIQRTVWELAQGTYTGWDAYPVGATVVFVRKSAGTASGSYSISGTSVIGSFAQTKAGAAATESFTAQASWNGDKLDGTGASGVTIDPTKLNVYQMDIQYLGAGAITVKAEVCGASQNNPDFVVLHTIKLPNTLTTTSFRNPAFPFTVAAYSAGSTTDLTIKIGSFAGFIEGNKHLHGNRFSYINTSTVVGSGSYVPLFTVQNARYYQGTTNQSVINLISVSGALKHTSPCIFYVIKNGSLTGNPNFSSYSTTSCSLVDTAATAVTFSTNDQLVWTGHLGDTGEIDHHFNGGGAEEFTLQPGEWITLAARSVTGTPSYVTGSINTREDQ